MDAKILLIDDDLVEAERFQGSLQRAGFAVVVAPPTLKAVRIARLQKPALLILGLNGRRQDACHFAQSLRRATSPTPLIIIPPGENEIAHADQQKVLDRPVTTRRLLYHVRRFLRDNKPVPLKLGNLMLDYDNQCVWKSDEQLILTPMEFKLLEFFMLKSGHVLSRKEIMQAVWETSFMGDTRTLYVHVRWLRSKLEDDACKHRYIRTVRGVGYVFEPLGED